MCTRSVHNQDRCPEPDKMLFHDIWFNAQQQKLWGVGWWGAVAVQGLSGHWSAGGTSLGLCI